MHQISEQLKTNRGQDIKTNRSITCIPKEPDNFREAHADKIEIIKIKIENWIADTTTKTLNHGVERRKQTNKITKQKRQK